MGTLKSWLTARDARLRWIDFEAYARRVFANDPADWYGDAARFAATLMQAQGVIGSDALIVDLTAPFVAGLAERDAAQVLARLGESGPQDFVADAFAALAHRFEGRLDLVLKLQAPWDLIGGGQPEFDALDDVGSALATCMRRFAERPVAALLLETARTAPLSSDEVDAYEPLFGAARHYGWSTALALPADQEGAVDAAGLDVDVLLWPARPAAGLPRQARPATGGGLDAAVWRGGALPEDDAALLWYGVIPADATPEVVVSVARALQA